MGGSIRIVQPGDPVPEAASWKNVGAYLARNWIRRDEDEPKVESVRDVSVKVERVPAPIPEPREADPAPQPELDLDDAETASAPETEFDDTDAESSTEPLTKKLLKKRTLAELREAAGLMGLETSGAKSDLIQAILGAQ